MINIYLNHFLLNGQMQNGWMFVETIPMPQGTAPIFTSIKVKTEMGKSETADITLDPNSPYWNSFVPYKTFIRVEVDGYTIFYGRVLTGSTTMWGNKTFQCEGPLSFMVDTYYPASKESGRAKISTLEYLTKVLEGHNYYVDYDDRSIYIGEVPGNYTSATSAPQQVETESQKFGVTSWTETKSAVEELRSYYGGYMRTRYNSSDGKVYLDWLNHYFDSSVNPQQIKLGRNLIDFSTNTEVSNIFTAIIPLGKNETTIEGYRNDVHGNGKWLSVPAICNIYTDAQLNQGYHKAEDYHNAITDHGWIYKTVSFPNASTKEELFSQACLWVKNNFQPEVENYTIKALDMRILGESGKPLLSGDRVTFSYSAGNSTLQPTIYTVISAEYDLYNPENNSYRIGIPANLLTKMFSVNSSGKSTSGGAGGYSPPEDENAGETEGYTDWLNKIIGFLLSHKVPNTNSYYLTPSSGRYRIYNAITGSFDTIDEVTYDAISSRGLLSYIGNNDPDKDEWNGIIFGQDSENTPAWTDYIKNFLATHPAPDGLALYNEGNGTMWNANGGYRSPISSFSIAQVEAFGLFDYVKNTFGVDLREVKIEEDIASGADSNPGTNVLTHWLTHTKLMRNVVTGLLDKTKNRFMEIKDGLLKFLDQNGNTVKDIAVQDDDGTDITLRNLKANWVNTDTRIGAVVTDDGKVNVGEIVLAINEDNTVDAIIHADRVKATGNDGAMFGIVTAEGTDNEKLDAGLIVSKIENDDESLETLTELIGQNIEIKGNNIKIDARDYASLGIVTTGLTWTDEKGIQHPVTSNVTAGLIVEAMNDGSMTEYQKQVIATLIADKVRIKGKNVDIGATEFAQLGIVTNGLVDEKGNPVDSELTAGLIVQKMQADNGEQEILAELMADHIKITGKNINISAAEYVSLGILTNDNLTAGLIVKKFESDDSNQKTMAELLADYVNITGSQITINATEAATLGIVTVGKDGSTNLDAGLVVSALNDGTITKGEKETVASLFGDYVNITANHIAKFGLVSKDSNVEGTTKLAAGLVVSALNDGSMTDTEKQTMASLFASKISITASQVADFGVKAQDAAGQKVTAKFIADTLNGGTATIQAKNLALDGVEVIDMINSTTVKVNAANVDLSGYLTAAQVRSGYIAAGTIDSTYINNEIGKLDNVTMKKATISGSLVMGDATLTTAQAPDILRGIKVVANGSTGYKLQGVTLGNPNWHDLANSSFDKAATISGSWGSGVFTVSATAGSTNTVRTSLTNTGHWGVAANGEDVNKYYYSTKATIGTSGTVYDTGNATIIDATARYNAGWTNCYNDVSLSKTGTLHLAGGVEYIVYPTGKQTPSGATQSMTGKALTIITDSDWNEALATVDVYPSYVPTLSPGQTKTIEVRARLDKQSSSVTTLRSITVQAAEISPATASVSGWTYYSNFPGGQEAGTANSNGYYQFRVGDTNRYYVYVDVPTSQVDPGPIGDAKLAYNTATHRVYVSAYGNQTSYTITETCDINWNSSSKQFYSTGIATIGNNITMAQATRYTDALRFVTSDSVVSVYMGSTQLMSVTHTAASSVTGKLLLNTSTHKVSVSSSSSATATEYIVTAEVSSLEWDASTKQFVATSIAKVGGTKMADSAEKRSTALSIDTTSSTTKVYLKQGSATLITADHTAGSAAARITYNTSNGTVYATTSGSTTSYAVGLTASTATWDATNNRYNLPVSALLDTSITIKSRTFTLPTLTLDTTSSTTQVYLKEGTTTRLTANHVAAGWAQYYNKKEWWSIATSQTSWYAYTPKEDASGSERWDCGARTAYTTGARTCFMGIGSAGTDICGTTRNIAPGDTLEVWAGGYDIDGNKVWNSNSVKFHSTAINGVPWIGGSDNKPVSDFKVEYNKSVDIWPAITAEDGAVGWGNKVTVSGPTSTITWGTPKATRSSSYSGTFISNIIATKDQYITIQVFANNVPKTYYIKMV